MADPGREPTVITRAKPKHAGAEPPADYQPSPTTPTPPPPVPTREVQRESRQTRRQTREPLTALDKSDVPHWARTLAELKAQRDMIDTAIAAIEALYG